MATETVAALALARRQKDRRLPSVDVPNAVEPELFRSLEAVKEHLRMYEGDSGAPKERFVTMAELENSGLLTADVKNKFAYISKILGADVSQPSAPSTIVQTINNIGRPFDGRITEPQIIDGLLLARVADVERITGAWIRATEETFLSGVPINWRNDLGDPIELLQFELSGAAGDPIVFEINETFTDSLESGTSYADTSNGLDQAQSDFGNNNEVLIVHHALIYNDSNSAADSNGYQLIVSGTLLDGAENLSEGIGSTPPISAANPYGYVGWFTCNTAGANIKSQLKRGSGGSNYVCTAETTFFIDLTASVPNHVKSKTTAPPQNIDGSTTFQNTSTTIALSPGDYLIYLGAQLTGFNGSISPEVGFNDGTTDISIMGGQVEDSATDKMVFGGAYFLENYAGGTLTVIAQLNSGSGTGDINYSSIIAIPMSDFNNYWVAQQGSAEQNLAFQSTDEDINSLSISSIPNTANYLAMAWVGTEYTGTQSTTGHEIQENVNSGGDVLIGWDNESKNRKFTSLAWGSQNIFSSVRAYTAGDQVDVNQVAINSNSGFAAEGHRNHGLLLIEMTEPGSLSEPFTVGDPAYDTVIDGLTTNITSADTDIDGDLNVDGSLAVGTTLFVGSTSLLSGDVNIAGFLTVIDPGGPTVVTLGNADEIILNTDDGPGPSIVMDMIGTEEVPRLILKSDNDVGIELYADDDNDNGEDSNPYILFSQDGEIVQANIGLSDADLDSLAFTFTGIDSNGIAIHNRYTSGAIGLGVNGNVALHIDSSNDMIASGDFTLAGTYHLTSDFLRTVAAASGGLEANNTLTGTGFERVLTTSDVASGGASLVAQYRFDTSTSEADPGNGDFRMDNATPASVTELFVSSTTDNSNDFDNILGFVSSGDQIYIQQDNDATKFILLDVTANVDQTGWYSIAGTISASGTLFDSNGKCHVLILFAGGGSEINDLSAIVTWADVPDANITEGSVTQHEAAIDHNALTNHVANEHLDWTASVGTIHTGNYIENVPTALSVGTITATTFGITSDGGADDVVLIEADTDDAGLLGSDKWDEIVANTLKVTNANHTGQVTGATALALDVTAVTDQPASGALIGADTIIVNDGGVLSESTMDQVAAFAGGGNVAKVNTPVDNELGVWTGDGTLEGDANLTWDGSALTIDVSGINLILNNSGEVDVYSPSQVNGTRIWQSGADFQIQGVNTTNFDITGFASIQAGAVDADFDALTATDFNGVPLTDGGAATNYLDETGAYSVPVGSGGTKRYYQVSGSGSTQVITGTPITMDLSDEQVTTGTGDFTIAADVVTLVQAGTYRISAQATTEDTDTGGSARTTIEIRIEADTVVIPGAITRFYHRETEDNSGYVECFYTAAADEDIRVRLDRLGAATNIQTVPALCRLNIELIS